MKKRIIKTIQKGSYISLKDWGNVIFAYPIDDTTKVSDPTNENDNDDNISLFDEHKLNKTQK